MLFNLHEWGRCAILKTLQTNLTGLNIIRFQHECARKEELVREGYGIRALETCGICYNKKMKEFPPPQEQPDHFSELHRKMIQPDTDPEVYRSEYLEFRKMVVDRIIELYNASPKDGLLRSGGDGAQSELNHLSAHIAHATLDTARSAIKFDDRLIADLIFEIYLASMIGKFKDFEFEIEMKKWSSDEVMAEESVYLNGLLEEYNQEKVNVPEGYISYKLLLKCIEKNLPRLTELAQAE